MSRQFTGWVVSFGRLIALLAALALAFSPWISYFSAIAYLDMTMTAFITVAYLLLWHATQRPKLFILVAILERMKAQPASIQRS